MDISVSKVVKKGEPPKHIQKEIDALVLDFKRARERAIKILELGRRAGYPSFSA